MENNTGRIYDDYYFNEVLRFKTVKEFLDVMRRGAEIVIIWKDLEFGIFKISDEPDEKNYTVAQHGSLYRKFVA